MIQKKSFVPEAVINKFSTYSQSAGISKDRLWLATFQTFLHRLSQEKRILVTAPMETDNHWIIFLAEFNSSKSFSELLKDNTTLPLEDFPVQALFKYQNKASVITPESFAPTISLELGKTAIWNFDPVHYSLNETDSIPKVFIHFAENLARDLNQACAKVSLLAPEEWAELESWNHTEADFPSEASLHGLISAQANRAPERIAAVYNGKCLSYGKMEQRANCLAHALIAAGV